FYDKPSSARQSNLVNNYSVSRPTVTSINSNSGIISSRSSKSRNISHRNNPCTTSAVSRDDRNRPSARLQSANYTGYNRSEALLSRRSRFLARGLSHNTDSAFAPGCDTPNNFGTAQTNKFEPLDKRQSIAYQTTDISPMQSIIAEEKQSPYDKMKKLEQTIHELVEFSCMAANTDNFTLALIKAKDALSKAATLEKLVEKLNPSLSIDNTSSRLTSARQILKDDKQQPMTTGINLKEVYLMVNTNLATQYFNNKLYSEATNIYENIAQGKLSSRLSMNLGNIHFVQHNYDKAIKVYRLIFDRLSSVDHKDFRTKIMRNIGLSFMNLSMIDAASAYDYIVSNKDAVDSHICGLHLVSIQYLMNDLEEMKKSFIKLTESSIPDHFMQPYLDKISLKDVPVIESLEFTSEEGLLDTDSNAATNISEDNALKDEANEISTVQVADSGTFFNNTIDAGGKSSPSRTPSFISAIKRDGLFRLIEEKVDKARHCVLMSANLIIKLSSTEHNSTVDKQIKEARSTHQIEASMRHRESRNDEGLEFCVKVLQNTQHFKEYASDIEISTAEKFIDQSLFDDAIKCLHEFESHKRNARSVAIAANNLSVIYFLQNDIDDALRYAQRAVHLRRHNSNALVNLGNCFMYLGNQKKARKCYENAKNINFNCLEAYYNLTLLTSLQLQSDQSQLSQKSASDELDLSLEAMAKLKLFMNDFAPFLMQSAIIHKQVGDLESSIDCLERISTNLGWIDPSTLLELSRSFEQLDPTHSSVVDNVQEAVKVFPSFIPAMERLAAIHIEQNAFARAIECFNTCAIMRPDLEKWDLLIALCLRRSGKYQEALQCYRIMLQKFPNSLRCLKNLATMCEDLGFNDDAKKYNNKITRIARYVNEARMTPAEASITPVSTPPSRHSSSSSRRVSANIRPKSRNKSDSLTDLLLDDDPIAGVTGSFLDRRTSASKQEYLHNLINQQEYEDIIASHKPRYARHRLQSLSIFCFTDTSIGRSYRARKDNEKKKREEREAKRAEVRARLEAASAKSQKKKGFMTPERKKKLRILLRKKAAEELKRQQEAKAAERRKVIAERCGQKENIEAMNELQLQSLCKQYHARIAQLESEKYDLEYNVQRSEFEIHDLSMKVNDMRGKFIKPPLRKVPQYEQKIERMLLNARKEIGFTVNLKAVKKDQFKVEDKDKDNKDQPPEWSWKKNKEGQSGQDSAGQAAAE
ncbi:Intraflagellar transport protein 88-like protein, partial [Fragariocoptes setiger]